MPKTTILLAEDELALGRIVKESLETRDFEVLWAKDGQEALKVYKNNSPELLVLDVMMPKKDGFSVATEIRQSNSSVPIIFLTSKSQTKDVVEGFEKGGNDYLKKPFSMEELIVRIKNLLHQKVEKTSHKIYPIGQYTFNLPKQTLQFNNEEPKQLTHREAQLLHQLYLHKNQVADRKQVLQKLWGNDDFFSARSMDVFISKLRKKLEEDPNIQIINIRGFGYKLVV